MAFNWKKARPVAGFAVFFVVLLVAAVWWLRPTPPAHPIEKLRAEATQARQQGNEPALDQSTIGRAWRWENYSDEDVEAIKEAAQEPEAYPFDVVAIYSALEQVELDANGNVVVDDAALGALERSLGRLPDDMSPEALAELQELIRIGLPGAAGEETADVVGDYYRFSQAKQQFLDSTPKPVSPEQMDAYQDQVRELRRSYLGADVAEKLYRDRDILTDYTVQSMRIEADESLSQEEKQQQLSELRESMPAGFFDEEAEQEPLFDSATEQQRWDRRYALYAKEKQQILNAGLTPAEEQAQIEALLQRHFDEGEIELARSYQPPQPEQDSDSGDDE